MTLAITGGTGFVGAALLDAARMRGEEVRVLTRRAQPPRAGVEWVTGDLADRAALAALVAGADAVIHVAGLVNARDAAAFDAANARGTLALVEAALAESARRFVLVSSLAAREPRLSAYGASKARAERLVRASALDWTIVRPPAVYGPGDREMFELFRAATWGLVPMPKAGRASLLHVADLARLLLALAPGGEEASHRLFEPDDGRPGGWEHGQLALAIGLALGKRPRVLGLSAKALARAARLDALLRRDRAKLTPDRASYMSHPDWVSRPAARVPIETWRPEIDTHIGLRATAEWYREQEWL